MLVQVTSVEASAGASSFSQLMGLVGKPGSKLGRPRCVGFRAKHPFSVPAAGFTI